jgi:meso-butanediol dehydrogenase/(S,S)-butanediol dehydrogenase/diacetyl reductase
MPKVRAENIESVHTAKSNNNITRLALVTGASHGIGRAIALKLSRSGYDLIINGRNKTELQETSSTIKSNNGAVTVECCDLRSATSRASLLKAITKHGNELHCLIHCASASTNPESDANLGDTSDDTIEDTVSTTIGSTIHLLKEAKPFLAAGRPSNIVIIGSDWAMRGSHGPPVFSAAKAAIGHLAHTIRHEYAADGISITTIYPGDVATSNKDWTEQKWQLDDPISKVQKELGNSRILLTDLIEAIMFAISRKMARVEEIHLAPIDPKYDY